MKRVSFIGIGDELLNGKIQDRNTYALSQFCRRNGYELSHSILIKDSKDAFNSALQFMMESSDIIITSGGLGPTKDDFTKDFLCDFFQLEMVENQQALAIAQKNYQEKKRIYHSDERDYHFLPIEMKALFNETGFAPGIYYKYKGKAILSLPGVPSEFDPMIKLHLEQKENEFELITYKIFGIPEAKIFQSIDPQLWDNLSQFGKVTSLPHLVGVDIGIEVSKKQDKSLIHQIMKDSDVWDHVVALSSKDIYQLVFEALCTKDIKVSFAESCTGGLLASHITDFSGSSQIYNGSIITYSNQIKSSELQVPETIINEYGVYSTQVTEYMSKEISKRFGTQLSIATSGVAGPHNEGEENPVGTLAFTIQYKEETYSRKIKLSFTQRERMKERFSQYIYFETLRFLNAL